MSLRTLSLFAFLLIGASCTPATQKSVQAEYDIGDPNSHIPDEYFVHLQRNHTIENHFQFIGKNLSHEAEMFYPIKYTNAYAVRLDSHTIHNIIRSDPGVKLVEHNHVLEREESVRNPEPVQHTGFFSKLLRRWSRTDTYARWNYAQVGLWGKRPTEDSYKGERMSFLKGAGKGVHIYILDEGIKIDHNYFNSGGGTAVNFKNMITTPYCGGGIESMVYDYYGHGTHVAGIAKWNAWDATIVNVKIASMSEILDEHLSYRSKKDTTEKGWRGSVINMSFDSGRSQIVAEMVARVIENGIPVVTSAGNDGWKNWATGPCGFPKVQCVSATRKSYFLGEESNYSPTMTTIIAPGMGITSAWILGKDSETVMSGTSQAAPHVAGTMAVFIGYEGIDNNVDLVNQRLMENAQSGLFSPRQPHKNNVMVNSGMVHPNRNGHHPYAGPGDNVVGPDGDFDGQNVEETRPTYRLVGPPETAVPPALPEFGGDGESGASSTVVVTLLLKSRPFLLPQRKITSLEVLSCVMYF